LISNIRCSIFGVRENKIIASTHARYAGTVNGGCSEKNIFSRPGDVPSQRISSPIEGVARKRVQPGSPVVKTRIISTPVPKQEISSPDTRLINPRFATLIRERTDPMDPQSTTHHAADPKKTPATNSVADKEEVP
jgi:hypothetical protein